MSAPLDALRRTFDYLSLQLLRRIEIRYRLILAFVLLALLPLLLSGYISYAESTKAIKEKTRVFSIEVVKQVSKNVQLRMAHIDAASGSLVLSDAAQRALAAVADGDAVAQSAARLDMTRLLLDHYGSFDFVNQKYLLDKYNRITDSQAFAQLTQGVVRFAEQAPTQQGSPYWGSYDDGVGRQNIGMLRPVVSKSSNRQLGNLFLAIRPEHFSIILEDVDLGNGTDIFILDAASGRVIVAPLGKPLPAAAPALLDRITRSMKNREQSSFVAFDGPAPGQQFAAYTAVPGTSWFVVSAIPEDRLTAEAQSVRNQIVLIGALCFLLAISFSYFIGYSISEPLKDLVDKMRASGSPADRADPQHAAENDDDGAELDGQDELGRLAQRFDRMHAAIEQKIAQINELNASLEHTVAERTAALGANERELRSLIENTPDTIVRYDGQCRRLYVNPAFTALAGSARSLLGSRPTEYPGGPSAAGYETRIKAVIASGENAEFELEWPDQDGRNICSHIRLTAERDTDAAAVTVLAVGRDITELRQRERELAGSRELLRDVEKRQALGRERQRLLQDMHDGLGSSLVSALRVVEHGRMDEAEVAQVLRGCLDDLKLAIDSMEPVEADLLLLLATLRFRLGPRLERTGIVLRWEAQDVPPLDWLDPGNALHILRILQEAFTNIIKHAQATEIRVATAVAGDYASVTITDNGCGFVVEEGLTRGGSGLSNQQRRAQAISGQVSWQSSAAGTCFSLRLPIKRLAAASATATTAAAATSG